MPDAHEDAVIGSLNLMLYAQIQNMPEDERDYFEAVLEDIQDEYEKALVVIKADKKATEEEKKQLEYAKAVAGALQKSIPDITKGILSAITAFNKGDNIGGAAAIMDICASIAPLLGVAASGIAFAGPVGMVFGGVFSMISAILGFFAPKSPSMKEEIKKLLDEIQAEDKIANVKGIRIACFVYGENLRSASKAIHELMQIAGIEKWNKGPFKGKFQRTLTEDSADDFQRKLSTVGELLTDAQSQLNVAIFEQWKVGGWLKIEVNQRNNLWPVVLSEWCQAYHELMSANVEIACLVNPGSLTQIDSLLKENSPLSLDYRVKLVIQGLVNTILGGKLNFLPLKFHAWNRAALDVLDNTADAARTRALYVGSAGGYFYSLANFIGRRRSGGLYFEYNKNTQWVGPMSVVAPAVTRPDEPQNEVFMVERTDDRRFMIWRYSLNPNTNALSDQTPVHAGMGIAFKVIDCWAQAGESTDISVSEGVRKSKFTKLYQLVQHYDRDITIIWNNEPTTQSIQQFYITGSSSGPYGPRVVPVWESQCGPNAHSMRAVYLAPGMTPDDPDYAALSDPNAKPSGLKLLARSEEIHYVGCAGTPSIQTWIDKAFYWIVGPGNQTQQHYSGIAIDPRFVWVFGNEPRCWFACATHGSIVKAAQGKGDPHWLRYDFDSQPPQTIRSLTPCADGTITLATENDLWSADYEVRPTPDNFKITILGNWANKREASVDQIQRLPIPCWSLYNSLRHDLKEAIKPAPAQ